MGDFAAKANRSSLNGCNLINTKGGGSRRDSYSPGLSVTLFLSCDLFDLFLFSQLAESLRAILKILSDDILRVE